VPTSGGLDARRPDRRDQRGGSSLFSRPARTRAGLVVIDPIVGFLDAGIAVSSDQGVRRALFPLAELAEKHGCAVLLVRHLGKSGGTRSVYRGGGSTGLLGACRSGWLIARNPQQPERRVLAQVMNNLAAPHLGLVCWSPRWRLGLVCRSPRWRLGLVCGSSRPGEY
jgi:hypothetical protein